MVALPSLDDGFTITYQGRRYERSYDDGACYVGLPYDQAEAAEAERAFRDAFVATAHLVGREWRAVDTKAIEASCQARQQALRQAEVLIPSADYFGVTDPEQRERFSAEQIAYQPGHRVEASRLRGIHHAMVYVEQAWEELEIEGAAWAFFTTFVLQRWTEAVDQWTALPINLGRCRPPPRPLETLTSEQRTAVVMADPVPPNVERLDAITAVKPRFRSATELVRAHPRLRPPIIEGLLREGETMNVIASPKMGKSWLVTDLALAVATGQPWLGYQTHCGQVLVLDNELHGETTANRVPKVAEARQILLREFGDRVFIENLRGHLVDIFALETYFDQIEARRFKIVVIDALYRFLPRGMEENDNGAMAEIYNRIDRYAERLGSSFILIHHTTKGSQAEKSVTDVGAGAGTQSRAADAHLVLRPHKEDGAVVLDAAVRSWPPIEARCLRRRFPVFDLADDLDPTELRGLRERSGGKKKSGDPEWTPEKFATQFIGAEPSDRETILLAATGAGLSRRQATSFLRTSEDVGLAHPWKIAANRKVKYSNQPQEQKDE
jgi:hypothetical protein